MTPDPAHAVFRLQTRLSDETRILVLEDISRSRLRRWLLRGAERPGSAGTHWSGEPELRPSEYPSLHVDAPIFTRRSLEVLGPELERGGDFIPVTVEGDDSEYVLYLVENVVDCLDERRSSKAQRTTGYVKHAVFLPDRLPDLPAFRVPQSPAVVYWTRPAAERIVDAIGPDVESLVVWSTDPALPAHPNPLRL